MSYKRLTPYGRVRMVRNVLAMYEQANEAERVYGAAWYRTAHDAVVAIATEHGLGVRKVAAVVAALSPSNEWLRNLDDAENYCMAFVEGRDMPPASTYGRQQTKAWAILDAARDADFPALLGPSALKTRAFYLSIAAPEENHGTVVVDGHTYNVACGTYTPLNDVPDLTTKGRYFPVAEAVCASAVIAGIVPQQMQATCWLTHRRLHLDVHADDFHPLTTTARL